MYVVCVSMHFFVIMEFTQLEPVTVAIALEATVENKIEKDEV